MNTIVKAMVQAEEPVIPADHPNAIKPADQAVFHKVFDYSGAIPPALQPKTSIQFLRAAEDVQVERAKEYDRPNGERSIEQVVTAWNAMTGKQMTVAEGWLFMQTLKNVRMFSAKSFHYDSARDGIAYASLMAEAKAAE